MASSLSVGVQQFGRCSPSAGRIDWFNRPRLHCKRVSPQPADHTPDALETEAYHITVDGGRDSFCALSIESPDNDRAWLISDSVVSLDSMR